ncbi:GVQW3 [Cordylochernes scorpioides]|uniref:GVQW3 n=1 Tax=Cordylochernes scorpioides TaxID=51811 RepID=A0ABY6L9P6_9ARAC|nr:GVQW3 [Cordylochernes scorpioides]
MTTAIKSIFEGDKDRKKVSIMSHSFLVVVIAALSITLVVADTPRNTHVCVIDHKRKCQAPKQQGPCEEGKRDHTVYYDVNTKACVKVPEGQCALGPNHFKSVEKCEKHCKQTLALMNESYEDEKLSRTQVYSCYKRFKDGRKIIADDSSSGRPLTSTTDRNIGQINLYLKIYLGFTKEDYIIREQEEVYSSMARCVGYLSTTAIKSILEGDKDRKKVLTMSHSFLVVVIAALSITLVVADIERNELITSYLRQQNVLLLQHRSNRIKLMQKKEKENKQINGIGIMMESSQDSVKNKSDNDKATNGKGKKLATNEATRHTLATIILHLTAALQGARSTQLETAFRSAIPRGGRRTQPPPTPGKMDGTADARATTPGKCQRGRTPTTEESSTAMPYPYTAPESNPRDPGQCKQSQNDIPVPDFPSIPRTVQAVPSPKQPTQDVPAEQTFRD